MYLELFPKWAFKYKAFSLSTIVYILHKEIENSSNKRNKRHNFLWLWGPTVCPLEVKGRKSDYKCMYEVMGQDNSPECLRKWLHHHCILLGCHPKWCAIQPKIYNSHHSKTPLHQGHHQKITCWNCLHWHCPGPPRVDNQRDVLQTSINVPDKDREANRSLPRQALIKNQWRHTLSSCFLCLIH